jgi:aryl-alcohol dehydrogenase-like predicted oxidoreductase
MAAAKLPAILQASIDGTKVSYTQLGSSGLRVSVPILGAMSLGSQKWQDWVVEGEEALQVLNAAWDKGMLFA